MDSSFSTSVLLCRFGLAACLPLVVLSKAPAQSVPVSRASRLITEDSTYLRQSLDSLIDWHAWGEAAFARARRENKALFVSIGYFSCHWCALMERETFNQPDVARLMNENFINVKVDRFERPDLDRSYMRFMTETSGKNGWPLNLWLTPDRAPFRGVIFLPAVDQGQGTFQAVAQQTARFWQKDSEYLKQQTLRDLDRFAAHIKPPEMMPLRITNDLFETALRQIAAQFDPTSGGFGRVPKFPAPARLEFLRRWIVRNGSSAVGRADRPPDGQDHSEEVRSMITKTLEGMARGSLRDHLGGGFFRYSLDDSWRRPYFEKLILDQAMAARSYLMGYVVNPNEAWAGIARETLGYAERELSHPAGGFYNGEHCESVREAKATSPEEGAFYLWRREELLKTVGDAAPVFELAYEPTGNGNAPPGSDPFKKLSGWNLLAETNSPGEISRRLNQPVEEIERSLANGRRALFEARASRPRPPLDRLVITQANGAMISALAQASAILSEPAYLKRAKVCARFVKTNLWDANKHQLFRCWLDRPATIPACSEDFAFLIEGLLDLYEASAEPEWLEFAAELQTSFDQGFLDSKDGGYFDAQTSAADLAIRLKNDDDASAVSSNALAALNLTRLAAILGRPEFLNTAKGILAAFPSHLSRNPGVVAGLTCAADSLRQPLLQVVIVGSATAPDVKTAREAVFRAPFARRVIVYLTETRREESTPATGQVPGSESLKPLPDGRPAVYFCRSLAVQSGPFPAAETAVHLRDLAP
ncbi:MAG: thioredoxin domain-containing protein [Verrucomicrobiales bacterium]